MPHDNAVRRIVVERGGLHALDEGRAALAVEPEPAMVNERQELAAPRRITVGDGVFEVLSMTTTVRRFTTIVNLHFMVGQNSCKRFSGAFAVVFVAKSVSSPIDVGF